MVTDSFWTDDNQALERLGESFIRLDNDVVYVETIRDSKVFYRNVENFGNSFSKNLSDKAWNKFRNLPPLGWINAKIESPRYNYIGAMYLRRNAMRARTHGFNAQNVMSFCFSKDTIIKSVATLKQVYESGIYKQEYPAFHAAFDTIKEGQSVALSSLYAIQKDTRGLCWLYRKRRPIVLVSDANTAHLLRSQRFYREELEDAKNILPIEIKEL